MNLDLTNKTALVCGSSQGLGKACAKQLAAMGASVVLLGRNGETLNQTLGELDSGSGQTHKVLIADFSDNQQVQKAIEDLNSSDTKINILVNNTGGPAPGPAHLADSQAFIDAFHMHLINNQLLVQGVLEGMKESGYGRIINIISTSVKQPLPGLGVSNTIRGAVANWAKTLANELGQYNITVNNVLPGATATQRLDAIISNKSKKLNKTEAEVIELEKATIPMGRFGEPEEFANAVGFLASPAAAYITGVNLPVDGGRTGCL